MNQGPAVIDPPAKRLKNVLRAMSSLGPGKKLPSFVTDTLFQVAGGPFKIEEKPQSQAPIVWQGIPAAAGTRTHPDTAVTFWGPMSDHDIAHETGHIVDERGVAQDAMQLVDAKREFYPHPGDYWSHNQREYLAEAFARALESGRHGFTDSTKVEKDMPGAGDLIHWLLTRPPFAKVKS